MNKWKEICLFFLLAIIACAVTLYQFNSEPRGLAIDEVEFAKTIVHLSKVPYQPFTPLADGHPTVYFYILMLSTKIFGLTSFGLRVPSALFGILSVFVLYKILQKVFSKQYLLYLPLAFWLAFLFATLRWRFSFTRFSFEMPYLLFLELCSLYFVVRISNIEYRISNKHYSLFNIQYSIFIILSGIFAGLAYNSYQPGRIFFLIPLVFFIFKKISWKQIGLYLGTFVLLILPMTVYLFQHPADDIRISQQSYISDSKVTLDKKIASFGSNIVSTARMFAFQGDLNGRHNYPGKPALNPFIAILFFIGLGLSLWQIKSKYNFLFLVYFVIALIPTLFTSPTENPHMLRTYTVIPAVIYFVGVSLIVLLKSKLVSRFKWIVLVIIVCSLLSAVYDIRSYFVYQSSVNVHAFPMFGNLNGILKSQKGL